MRTKLHPWGLTLALVSACAGRVQTTAHVAPCLVDLSYPYDEHTVYWPTAPSTFDKETLSYGETDGGFFYSAYTFSTPEHGGTHVDAPIHFAEGQATVDEIPIERLVGPGVVIDMTEAASADRDALLSAEAIEAFEADHGPIAPETIVFVRTGWSKYWPDAMAYLGDDTPGDASNLHFPGLSEDAARALANRGVAAVGIDTASIDHGPSKDFLAHRVLGEAGIPVFENVASLERIPETGARIIALPMKIGGGSGAPVRIVAEVPGGCREGSFAVVPNASATFLFCDRSAPMTLLSSG